MGKNLYTSYAIRLGAPKIGSVFWNETRKNVRSEFDIYFALLVEVF